MVEYLHMGRQALSVTWLITKSKCPKKQRKMYVDSVIGLLLIKKTKTISSSNLAIFSRYVASSEVVAVVSCSKVDFKTVTSQ